LVLPIETFALTANNSGTSSVYSDRIRPSSFYGLSANDIQTHGASSITPGNSNGGVVASSNSAPRYSASSNSITPGSQNNSNSNVVSFSNTAVISVPNVTSQSYFSDSYGADSYETLASGNNNVPGENFGNESLDSGDPLYASAISNESYFNDSESDSPNRSGSYQSESINGEDFSSSNLYGDNERSSSFASSNTRSGSFSSGSTKSASVYSGVVKPASVRNVVSTPTKQVASVVQAVPVKQITSCEPYLKTYLGCGFGDDRNEVVKLQKFLRDYEGYDIKVTGVYDNVTFNTVRKFQEKYSLQVLKESWGITCSTGCVYITTRAKINDIVCKKTTNYKTIQLPNPRPNFVCPDAKDLKTGKIKINSEIAKNCPYLKV
jgi:hypothetical protein